MRLKSVEIRDFRRFTHLTVSEIPKTARLIMLAGPNGCGKSSFFDALHVWHSWKSKKGLIWEVDYHRKVGSSHSSKRPFNNTQDIQVSFHSDQASINKPDVYKSKKSFYMRSAYRNSSQFQVNTLNSLGDQLDEIRISRMIDNDIAGKNNFERLISQILQGVCAPKNDSETIKEFRGRLIGGIGNEYSKLFEDIKLDGLGDDPLKDGTFRFTKGTSEGFLFKNLSGGEKAAFDLIFDLIVAQIAYNDTVFCIDEPEAHISAKLQGKLLSVLYDLIPENCQLMLATHSIGMMRQARDMQDADPGAVVFLDFGELDFDQPQTIEPTKPDRTFWERAYNVAFNDLAALVAPERVVICEGHPRTDSQVNNHSHDARCYERIFEAEFPETKFVSMGNCNAVLSDKSGLAKTLKLLVPRLKVVKLIDRDDRSDQDIDDVKKTGGCVLSRRNLESFLFDDEVLRALAVSKGKEDKVEELLQKKEDICREHIRKDESSASRGNLKPVRGPLYTACTTILKLNQHGNQPMSFMRDTLAPLVKPDMSVYKELKSDIFGKETGP